MLYTCVMRLFLAILALIASGCGTIGHADDKKPLETVTFVDLSRYIGEWYEIASFPQRFQKDCVATKATYSLEKEGSIKVVNECHLKTFHGQRKVARGSAEVVDTETNAKLKVTFFWPFYGKYWVIDLGKDYEYAVVGHPDRDYLWILNRTRKMDKAVLDGILERLRNQGYDLSKLRMTPQP